MSLSHCITRFLPLALLASSACASSVQSFSQTIGLTPTDFDTTVSLPMFDPSQGTLTGVTLTETASIQGSQTLTNNNPGAANIVAKTDTMVILTGLNPSDTLVADPSYMTPLISLLPGAMATYNYFSSDSTQSISAAEIANYIGMSNFTVPVDTLTSVVITGGGGNVTATTTNGAVTTVAVSYVYDQLASVPEPASAGLILIGLAGVAMYTLQKRAGWHL